MFRALLALALVIQAPAPQAFDSNKAWEHLRQMVALGPRPSGSPAIDQTRTYIKSQLAAAGVSVTEQAWDDQTPTGRVHMINLIATIPGASKDRLVVGGHYDTKKFREIRFVGANDGGSSAAFLIELARVLKARRNPLTIELLFLDGEEAVVEWQGEDHTYGSRHYVAEAKRSGSLASLKAFVLVDMIGDRDLQIKRDLNSTAWLTDIIWAAAQKAQLTAFRPERVQIEDDHLPFMEARVPSVDIIDLEYPAWHTAGDTLEAVSARSLQVVGDALLAALPQIESRLSK
jgi:glutaminyl-peptide cyclotransferase